MRVLLTTRSSTKAERLFAEILKKNHIPFLHRTKLEGKEIDFIVGNYAIEIDGHPQSSERNSWLLKLGYIPLHYQNKALYNNLSVVEESILSKYDIFSSNNRSFTRQIRKSL